MFKYYWCRSIHLFEFCFYAYFAIILIIKYKKFGGQIFELKELYPYKLNLIQRYYIKPGFKFFAALIKILF